MWSHGPIQHREVTYNTPVQSKADVDRNIRRPLSSEITINQSGGRSGVSADHVIDLLKTIHKPSLKRRSADSHDMGSIAKRPCIFEPDIIDLTMSPIKERKKLKEQTTDTKWDQPLSKFIEFIRGQIDVNDPIVYLERFYVMSMVTYKFSPYKDYGKGL